MDPGDFSGAAAGGVGGLVKWHGDPRHGTAHYVVTSMITSVACGVGFGYLTQAVIQWQLPEVPHSVAVGLAFVAGLASGVLGQVAVGLVSELTQLAKLKLVNKLGGDDGQQRTHPAGIEQPVPRPAGVPGAVPPVPTDAVRLSGKPAGGQPKAG